MSEAAHPSPITFPAKSFAAQDPKSPLAKHTIQRRSPRPQDVQIEILFCGVCHSDLHQVRNEWKEVMPTVYPCVPGHEIVGRVVKVGRDVKKFKEGDIAAVGCMVDSCGVCASCKAGEEQYCENMLTLTYNGEDKILGGVTYGGYCESIVVDEAFVLKVPDGLDAEVFSFKALETAARQARRAVDREHEHGVRLGLLRHPDQGSGPILSAAGDKRTNGSGPD